MGTLQHLIPQEALSRKEVEKQKQIMIPDFRIQLVSQPGQTETRLAELKYTCGRKYYKPGVRQREFVKAVNRRAGELMGEYRDKAANMDRLLGEEGQGRVRRRLDQFGELVGLVVGQFNEASGDTHMLLEQIADSRVAGMARRDGRQLAEHERGVVIGQLRRQLSTVAIRAGTQCLLDRMHQCGQGAAMAAKRREVNLRVEEMMRREREIQWLAKVRGGRLVRKGEFMRE